jgi:hypothetical protein
MKWRVTLFAGLALMTFACTADDESDGPISPDATSVIPTPSPSPTSVADTAQATLDRIRPLVVSALGVSQNTVRDVDIDGRKVTVTLQQEQSLGGATDFDDVCEKVNDVIGFLDVEVVVRSSSGIQLATCS